MNQVTIRRESREPPKVPELFETEWLARQLAAVRGKYPSYTIAASMMPSADDRRHIASRVMDLKAAERELDHTVAGAYLTGFLVSFPAEKLKADLADAKAEFYMIAVDGIPAWAVVEACRRWVRRETELHKRGKAKLGYAPSPDQLNAVAREVLGEVVGHRLALENLLRAKVEETFGNEPRISPERMNEILRRPAPEPLPGESVKQMRERLEAERVAG